MTPKLSILICSLECRRNFLMRLMAILQHQEKAAGTAVEILVDVDNGERSIGSKRQGLLARAKGDWIAFIDDDDVVSSQYVSSILTALENDPDCVGFLLERYENNLPESIAIHSLRYEKYGKHRDGARIVYERTPNHLNPVRRSIALAGGFPDMDWGEDSQYANAIYPLLKSECFVEEVLYHYLYRSSNERRGEKTHANPA